MAQPNLQRLLTHSITFALTEGTRKTHSATFTLTEGITKMEVIKNLGGAGKLQMAGCLLAEQAPAASHGLNGPWQSPETLGWPLEQEQWPQLPSVAVPSSVPAVPAEPAVLVEPAVLAEHVLDA